RKGRTRTRAHHEVDRMKWTLLCGDSRDVLDTLPAESVHCIVTSPPYFNLRDYGHEQQIGMESLPDAFIAALVDVFARARRVLRDDGVLWLNLGDSYAGSWGAQSRPQGAIGWGCKPKDLIGIPWM